MNKRQKALLVEAGTVLFITAIAVVAMINLKDYINRSEAMRAMDQLGQKVIQYRRTHGAVPPESYIDSIKETLEGYVRLGKLYYRARWVSIDAGPDQILAYTKKRYRSSFLDDGYAVLWLDGRVEWMPIKEFERLLAHQQSPLEIEQTSR